MNPGETTKPSASMILAQSGLKTSPISMMRSPLIAIAPLNVERPLPSTIRPLLINRVGVTLPFTSTTITLLVELPSPLIRG